MQERCTCGALLPEDALFCHKCGKPQREILVAAEPEPAPPEPPPLPPPAPPRIGFHNGVAVRIGILGGILLIFVASLIGQIAVALAPLWMIAAGIACVFFYRWRTGEKLTAMSGAHLGWICGVFGFLIASVLTAIMLAQPSSMEAISSQWKQHGMSDAEVNQMITALHSPFNLVVALAFVFVLFTVLPAFGGAIGAKLLDRD